MKSLGESPMPENEKPIPIPDDPEQSKRFEEAARLLGVDETGKAFNKMIRVVVAPKPASRSRPS